MKPHLVVYNYRRLLKSPFVEINQHVYHNNRDARVTTKKCPTLWLDQRRQVSRFTLADQKNNALRISCPPNIHFVYEARHVASMRAFVDIRHGWQVTGDIRVVAGFHKVIGSAKIPAMWPESVHGDFWRIPRSDNFGVTRIAFTSDRVYLNVWKKKKKINQFLYT